MFCTAAWYAQLCEQDRIDDTARVCFLFFLAARKNQRAPRQSQIHSAAALAMPFPPSAACRNLDLPPVNLRFLQLHLTKNTYAIAPPRRIIDCPGAVNLFMRGDCPLGIPPYLRCSADFKLKRRSGVSDTTNIGYLQ